MNLISGTLASLWLMHEDDAAEVVAWRNQPENARWLVQWEPLTESQHLQWQRKATTDGDWNFVIRSTSGKAIGACSLYNFDRLRGSAEWGRLCTSTPGQVGLPVIEGCYFILRFAFEVLKLKRVHGACATENNAAYRFNSFFGFVTEGRRRRHLLTPRGYLDTFELGLFPEEFSVARTKVESLFYKEAPVPQFSTDPKS